MLNYTLNNETGKITITKNEEIIFSFDIGLYNKESYNTNRVYFLKSKNIDYAIIKVNDKTSFPEYHLVNLETKEDKFLLNDSKGGIIDLTYNEDFILIKCYPYGQIITNCLFNFNSDEIYLDDFIDSKYLDNDLIDTSENGITIDNGELTLNIIVKKKYFDLFDFSNLLFTIKEDNLVIIPFYQYPSKKELLNIDKLLSIQSFINNYKKSEIVQNYANFFIGKNNIFKVLYDMNEKSNNIFSLSKNILPNIPNLKDLKKDDIIDLSCNGLYSNNNYINHYNNFLSFITNLPLFYEFLVKQTLGYEYLTEGSVKKELIPDGIGLKFIIKIKGNINYQFIIKMSLHELEDDNTRVTYVQGKSKLDIDILTYID